MFKSKKEFIIWSADQEYLRSNLEKKIDSKEKHKEKKVVKDFMKLSEEEFASKTIEEKVNLIFTVVQEMLKV